MKELTFQMLQEAGSRRLRDFKNAQGQLAHPGGNPSNWSIDQWTNAIAGEVGEACNIAKKLNRGDFAPGPQTIEAIQLLLDEIADVVIYADLTCQRVGAKLEDAVIRKFNKTSTKVGSRVFLALDGE